MLADMRQALDERRDLIQDRAEVCLDTALADAEPWIATLGTAPTTAREAALWRQHAIVVAAYRDRYRITTTSPLGAESDSAAQRIDAARARSALDRAGELARRKDSAPTPQRPTRTTGRTL